MTVIVYKNRILASDSLVTVDDLRLYNTKKIIKTKDGFLAGASGENDFCLKFLSWVDTKRRAKPPKIDDNSGLMITSDGEVRYYSDYGYDIVEDEYIAIGSGQQIALGALYMGATAEEAVAASIKHISNCGYPVQILKLGD